jgi:hypothetical protein
MFHEPRHQQYNVLVRTYTHAIVSCLISARLSGRRNAAWASAGAFAPDVPALAGSAWLLLKSRRLSREAFYGEVCGRRHFRIPDAALHSAAVLAVPGALVLASRLAGRAAPGETRATAFLLGWAGHVASDVLTHGSDARPPLWPLSGWRFESPVSYRELDRHGLAFTLAEHGVLLALLYGALRRRI